MAIPLLSPLKVLSFVLLIHINKELKQCRILCFGLFLPSASLYLPDLVPCMYIYICIYVSEDTFLIFLHTTLNEQFIYIVYMWDWKCHIGVW